MHPYNRMQRSSCVHQALFNRGPFSGISSTHFSSADLIPSSISMRVSRGEFDRCVACFARSSIYCRHSGIRRPAFIEIAKSFLPDAEWTPVGGKLWSDQRYQNEFVSRDEGVYHYFDLRRPPALGKGRRGRRKSTAPAVKSAHFSLHRYPPVGIHMQCHAPFSFLSGSVSALAARSASLLLYPI
jgi:hypothetical protein